MFAICQEIDLKTALTLKCLLEALGLKAQGMYISQTERMDRVFQIPPGRDFAPGVTGLFSAIGALRARC
jgi:hypothetical protein